MTIDWEALSSKAWAVREHARILGRTPVGCAAMSSDGSVWLGCNVEHGFRSHDVHAEVNAISTMVAGGQRQLVAVMVAADRNRFTPCGACLDWIFEFGGGGCSVGWQRTVGGEVVVRSADELMPYYPN